MKLTVDNTSMDFGEATEAKLAGVMGDFYVPTWVPRWWPLPWPRKWRKIGSLACDHTGLGCVSPKSILEYGQEFVLYCPKGQEKLSE